MRTLLLCSILTLPLRGQTPDLRLRGDRFRPLDYEHLTAEQKIMADHVIGGDRGSMSGPYNVLLRSPEMGDLVQQLGAYLRFHSAVPDKLKEFAIILTARFWNSQHEWYTHKKLALHAGVSSPIVEAVRVGERPKHMQSEEEAVYNFVTELNKSKQVSDPVFQAALEKLGEKGTVDLMALVGYYHLVSIILNVDRYPLVDGVKPELKPLP
jgi:4-carboxymuconolactone decarboxylase